MSTLSKSLNKTYILIISGKVVNATKKRGKTERKVKKRDSSY